MHASLAHATLGCSRYQQYTHSLGWTLKNWTHHDMVLLCHQIDRSLLSTISDLRQIISVTSKMWPWKIPFFKKKKEKILLLHLVQLLYFRITYTKPWISKTQNKVTLTYIANISAIVIKITHIIMWMKEKKILL